MFYLPVRDGVVVDPHFGVNVFKVPAETPTLQPLPQGKAFGDVSKVNARVLCRKVHTKTLGKLGVSVRRCFIRRSRPKARAAERTPSGGSGPVTWAPQYSSISCDQCWVNSNQLIDDKPSCHRLQRHLRMPNDGLIQELTCKPISVLWVFLPLL